MADDKNKNAADKAAKEAEAKAQREAAEAAKAKAAQEKARRDAEAKAKAEQEKAKAAQEKAAKEAQARAQREAADAAKAKAAQEKARRDAEAKAKAEQEKAKAAQEKAAKEAQARAQKEAAAKEKAQKNASKESKKAEKSAKIIAEAGPLPEGSATGKVKLTRKQKKALLEQQKQREKELVEAGEIPLRRRYKPRGLFWRILGVCLAFFMGIFATVGAIVGASAFLLTKKSRDVVDFVLDFTGSELSPNDILTEEYLNKTLSELIHDAQTNILDPLIGDPGNLTLKTLASFTPIVDKYIDDLAAEYLNDLGISIDLNELKEQKFADFVSYAKTSILPKVELGPLLELDTDVTLESIDKDAPLYTICYGTYLKDYKITADGTVEMLDGKHPTSITDLLPSLAETESEAPAAQPTAATDGSAGSDDGMMDFIGDLELGSFLGLDIRLESEQANEDDLMYSLCYGTLGVDYELQPIEGTNHQRVVMLAGHEDSARSLNYFVENPNTIIEDMKLDEVIDITPTSEAIFRTLAYGNELAKDENGNYLKDAEGNYLIEPAVDKDGNPVEGQLQYAGGGRYVIEGEGDAAKIVMLPDPNDPEHKPYAKKSISDLTSDEGDDNSILNDITIGSVVGDGDSKLLHAISSWTIKDLSKQDKIESLLLGDVLDLDDATGIMNAIKGWSLKELSESSRIERLRLNQILDIDPADPNTASIMKSMASWRISELTEKSRIDSLTLGDVIDIDETSNNTPEMLKALKNKTLGEISTSIDTLTLEDVLGEGAFDGNKILAALRHKQIKDLGTSIQELTVEDVFGSDIWSYAKLANYNASERVADENKIDATNIEEKYYHSGTPVDGAYYTQKADGSWTKVPDQKSVKHGSYIEVETELEYRPEYYVIDYDKPEEEWVKYSGSTDNVQHEDEFTDYYTDAEGVRHDLKTVEHFFDGETEVFRKNQKINYNKDSGTYSYIKHVNVEYRYAATEGTETYTKSEIETRYFDKTNETEAQPYHAGVWYLLLGEAETMPKITDMGSLVTGVADTINTMTLGNMYVHELIEKDPSNCDLTGLHALGLATSHDNLGDLNISEVIDLVDELVRKVTSGY